MDNTNGNGNNGIMRYVSPIAGGGLTNVPKHMRGLRYDSNPINPPGNALSLAQNLTTESLLGEGCIDARHYVCDKARTIPGYYTPDSGVIARTPDYPIVGTVGQVRAAIEDLFARGRNMGNNFLLTVGGTTFTGTFDAAVGPAPVTGAFPRSIGFVLDWSVSMLAFAPFDMPITTTNWVGDDLQPLNRTMTLRVTRPSGSSIYIPWAQRLTPTMSAAQVQLAKPLGSVESVGTIAVGPLPANIAASFSASVSFMTAFSPQVAAYAAYNMIYGNIIGDVFAQDGTPVYPAE